MKPQMEPNEIIDRFARLARAQAGDTLTAAEHGGLQRLERTLAQRRSPQRRLRMFGAAGLVAAVAAACVVFWLRPHALTFVVTHGRAAEGGYIVADGDDTAVRFSDQSELGLSAGSRLRVSHLEVRGARLMLEGGLVRVHIRPRPQASWAIDAGPYVVRVTGTEFDLVWKADEQTLDLDLYRGTVTVEGPLANGDVRMVAGQHLVAHARDGSLSIVGDSGPTAAAGPTAPSVAAGTADNHDVASGDDAPATPSSPSIEHAGSAATSPARPMASVAVDWTAQIARGDYDAVTSSAEHLGVDRVLAEAPLPGLAALADAARYTRRPDMAQRVLNAERARFPSSVQAHDAAFFLGSLAEGQGDSAGALQWVDTYLHESPNGAYASQALGHKVLLVKELQGVAKARPIAAEYLDRYRDGAYAPYARKLLQMQ